MAQLLAHLPSIADGETRGRVADHLFGWTIGNRLFELGDLNPPARAVSWFGYGSLLTLLGSMLALQWTGVGSPVKGLVAPEASYRVPTEVVVIACMGFVAGWSLLLTGALYARRAIATVFLVGFGIQLIILGARIVFVSLLLIVLAGGLQVLFRRKPSLRDWSLGPVASLLLWILLLSGLVVLAWTAGPRSDTFVSLLTSVMSVTSVFAIVLWMAMACGAVVTAVRLSIAVVGFLRPRLSSTAFKVMAAAIGCLLGPALMAFGIAETAPAWMMGGCASLGLVPLVPVLVLRGGWSASRAAVVAGLSFALPVYVFGLSLAMSGSSPVAPGDQAAGVLPPVLLFLVLAADNLLRFGKPIKRAAPQLGSRVAWVLSYLGLVVLILTALLFLMNHPSAPTGRVSQPWPQTLSALTLATMLVTGPVYLAWVVWRRSTWWAGPEELERLE